MCFLFGAAPSERPFVLTAPSAGVPLPALEDYSKLLLLLLL